MNPKWSTTNVEFLTTLVTFFFIGLAALIGLIVLGKFTAFRNALNNGQHPARRDAMHRPQMMRQTPSQHHPHQFNDPSFQLGYNIGLSLVRLFALRNRPSK